MAAVLDNLINENAPDPKHGKRQSVGPAIYLKWVLIPIFCACTGYSDKAVRRKIQEGKWIEGKHYRKAPDGHITMNLQEYYAWVEGQQGA